MNVSKTKFVVVTIGIMMIFLNYYIMAVDIVQLSPGWEYRAGITTVILIVYSLISLYYSLTEQAKENSNEYPAYET